MRRSLSFPVVVILLALIASLLGCSHAIPTSSPISTPASSAFQTVATTAPTDYSLADNWIAAPQSTDKPADVFYLYPTVFQRASNEAPVTSEIDDPGMRERAPWAYERQASVYEPVANVFAPYYRQLDAYCALVLPEAELDELVGGIPATDATAAFEYYLEHYNNGRPFIRAGHSQGSDVLLFLLSGYLKEHPEMYQRMVAAYVIGYSVTTRFLEANPHLKFAEGADDTGVVVSWNTEAPEVEGENPVVKPGSLAINPISWTRDETTATAQQNLGSLVKENGDLARNDDGSFKIVADYADARVDLKRGVIICSTVPVDELAPGSDLFPRGVFHTFDYSFFYMNIRSNVAERIAAYLGE